MQIISKWNFKILYSGYLFVDYFVFFFTFYRSFRKDAGIRSIKAIAWKCKERTQEAWGKGRIDEKRDPVFEEGERQALPGNIENESAFKKSNGNRKRNLNRGRNSGYSIIDWANKRKKWGL